MAWPPSMPEQRGEPSLLERALDVVGGEREREPVGIARDHPARDVDLLELHPRVAAVLASRPAM